MTWPSVDAPATAPTDHGDVRTQAYYAGGGDVFRSGYYSHGLFTSSATSTAGLTLNKVLWRPFPVPVRRSFDRIGVNVTAAGTAGAVLRLGIYANAGGRPGSLVVDAGTVGSTTTGGKEVTISQSLDPGIYWLAVVAQTVTCTVTQYNFNTTSPWTSYTTTPPSEVGFAWGQTSVSGALPSTPTPAENTGQGWPAISLRAA